MRYSFTGKTLGCELDENEQLWLKTNQPQLFYLHRERKAYGYFSFNSVYDCGVHICDKYEIAIDFNRMEYRSLPKVYEVGNRIRKVAKLYNKDLIDLHQYPDNRLCLLRPDVFTAVFEKRPFTIHIFCEIINSFIYWPSYFEKFGQGPWAAEEHGWDWLKQYIQV